MKRSSNDARSSLCVSCKFGQICLRLPEKLYSLPWPFAVAGMYLKHSCLIVHALLLVQGVISARPLVEPFSVYCRAPLRASTSIT